MKTPTEPSKIETGYKYELSSKWRDFVKQLLKMFFIVCVFTSCSGITSEKKAHVPGYPGYIDTLNESVPVTKGPGSLLWAKIKSLGRVLSVKKTMKYIGVAGVAIAVFACACFCLDNNAAIEQACRDAVGIRIAKVLANVTPDQRSFAIQLGTERCVSKFYHSDYSFISDMKTRIKAILHDEYGTFQWGWQNGEQLPW